MLLAPTVRLPEFVSEPIVVKSRSFSRVKLPELFASGSSLAKRDPGPSRITSALFVVSAGALTRSMLLAAKTCQVPAVSVPLETCATVGLSIRTVPASTASVPVLPPAPGRLSMMKGWPIDFAARSSKMRVTTSLALPPANGTITWIGRAG